MWTAKWRAPGVMVCALFAVALLAAAVQGDEEVPSESQCRPYIEKALKELEGSEAHSDSLEDGDQSKEAVGASDERDDGGTPSDSGEDDDGNAEVENDDDDSKQENDDTASVEVADEPYTGDNDQETDDDNSKEDQDGDSKEDNKDDDDDDSKEEKKEDDDSGEQAKDDNDSKETAEKNDSTEDGDSKEEQKIEDGHNDENQEDDNSKENEISDGGDDDSGEASVEEKGVEKDSVEDVEGVADKDDDDDDSKEDTTNDDKSDDQSEENEQAKSDDDDDDSGEGAGNDKSTENQVDSKEDDKESKEDDKDSKEDDKDSKEDDKDSKEDDNDSKESKEEPEAKSVEDDDDDSKEGTPDKSDKSEEKEGGDSEEDDDDSDEEKEEIPEEDLLKEPAIPANLRSRQHITQILRLDQDSSENEVVIERSADIVLRDLKRIYENNIKPLEVLYKYRDLSNRHFGDPEIFSKPLLLLMGPWSGGKSSICNYLTDIEYTEWSLRTGAEPSPAYFNILMHGKEPEVLDGTQLAADWTFSGLQKFGQGLEERLRGLKYPSKLLEKINIVEIPGILEVRKQVSRVFPFNDACQWFIDRADIIFLVYDPSKLDVGPETEAILDQLKGRESQVRIILNKADIVKPEELLRVQGALIWNISPLMSSAAPPALYAASLWSRPLAPNAPNRLLAAQERALLADLRSAVDRRIDNKIASARRFAVRVRNHAKMVDCYLTTYYNHKTIFGNRKLIAEAIIEHPQNYHIYEGLSTLTNISRYDLPDPESYRDFFRLNPLYDFQPLSSTCTYFRGCPINRLDIAIAYDLPELVGKYKKMVESAVPQGMPKT